MDKVWLNSYHDDVPAEINVSSERSIINLLDEAVDKFSDLPAFSNFGAKLRFKEIDILSLKFAAYLQKSLKLSKGDKLAIMMPNILQYPVVLFGALRLGVILVNINPLYTARELSEQLKDSQVETIVILQNFIDTLSEALPNTRIKNIIITQIGDLLKFPKSFVFNFVSKYIKKIIPRTKINNAIYFHKILQNNNLEFDKVKITGSDVAFLQYTGGTTGKAKGAILTHTNIVSNVEQISQWLRVIINPGQEIIITALPLYHIFSLTANFFCFFKYGSLNVLVTNPKDTKGCIQEISKYQFTCMTGVNTLFNNLVNNSNFKHINFSFLKLVVSGGMSLQKAVSEKWNKITNTSIIEAYGLTETSPAVCINPVNIKDYNGSIGLPIPSTEITIRDNFGKELSFNQPGELWVKGPQVMQGYWGQKEETMKVFDKQGWFKTGDIAIVDLKGYVKIVDRKKDMIIVSGFNVYPNEIEQVISGMDQVLEVAVIGVPDVFHGEAIKAIIVKKDMVDLTEEELKRYCYKFLTHYKVPKIIEFVDALPKNNIGKVLRKDLKK